MIEVKNLTFSYGKEPFLEVNTSFLNGCLTVLVGKNGSGKTTLLKLINQMEKAKTGSVVIDGFDVSEISKKQTAKMLSYFPQSRPIPDMSVDEAVGLGRYPYGDRPDRAFVTELLEKVNALELLGRNMKSLSFGERQRVYTAMLLAQDTQNAVFDEPVTFMDVSSSFAMLKGLREMCNAGKCIICVLHDISFAMRYANRIVVMNDGKIADDGSPQEIYERGTIDKIFDIRLEKHISNGKGIYLPLPQ